MDCVFSSKRTNQKINLSKSLYDSMNMYLKKLVNKYEISSKEKLIELYTDMRNSFKNILNEKKKNFHKTSFGHNKTPYQNVVLPGISATAQTIDPTDTAGDKCLRKVIGYFDMLIKLTNDEQKNLEEWYDRTSYYGHLLETQKLEFHILKSFLELNVSEKERGTRPIDLIRKIGAKLKSDDFKVILANVYNNYEGKKNQEIGEAKKQANENKTKLEAIIKLLREFVKKNLEYKRLIEMKGISRDEEKTREIRKLGAVIRLKLVELWASRESNKCDELFLTEEFHNLKSRTDTSTKLPWGDNWGIVRLTPGDYDNVSLCLRGYPLGNAVLVNGESGLKPNKARTGRGEEPNLTPEEKEFLENVNNINKNYSTQILRNN